MFWRALAIAIVSGLVLRAAGAAGLDGWPAVHGAPSRRSTPRMDTYVRIRLLAAPLHARELCHPRLPARAAARATWACRSSCCSTASTSCCPSILGLELGWGVAGVAWGAVAGECVAAVVGLALVSRRFARRPAPVARPPAGPDALRRHAVAQPRHHDPLLRAAGSLCAVHPSGRAVRHADAGRQCRADELLHGQRLSSSTVSPPPPNSLSAAPSARATGWPSAGRAAHLALGLCARRRFAALAVLVGGDGLIALITTAPDVQSAAARLSALGRLHRAVAACLPSRWTASSSAPPGRATCAT